jgi:dihydrofolate synthase/folylpolyglutamate synthase
MATNAAHALAAYDVLRRRGLVATLDKPVLRRTFEQLYLPACCEVLGEQPTIVIDGAHNASASASLASTIRSIRDGRRTVLLVSLPREKEVDKIIRHLAGAEAGHAVFTRYPESRAAAPQELAAIWRSCTQAPTEVVTDPAEAFQRAVREAGPQGLVVVTGSLDLGGYCRPLAESEASNAVG